MSIACQVTTLLLVGLLVMSAIVPAPAAAQASNETCLYEQAGLEWFVFDCQPEATHDTTDLDREQAMVQLDLNNLAVSERENAEQIRQIMENYGQDTGTLASLEARHAIASAYENGTDPSIADSNAKAAIEDYYAQRQKSTLAASSKHAAQMAYIANASQQHSEIPDDYIRALDYDLETDNTDLDPVDHTRLTGTTTPVNATLVNGEQYEYQGLDVWFNATLNDMGHSADLNETVRLEHFRGNKTSDDFFYTLEYGSHNYNNLKEYDTQVSGDIVAWVFGGKLYIDPSNYDTEYPIEDGQPGTVPLNINDYAYLMDMWQNQSDEVVANYQNGLAADLYDALDAGQITTAELRSAEGQVRFMSGESEVTSQRFRVALLSTLDLNGVDLQNASRMTVSYTGYTDVDWNVTETSREPIYSGYVDNRSYEGLLFATDTPDGGFDKGVEYNVSELNATVLMQTQNGTQVPFAKGNFTIESMTDDDGNEVENIGWEQPQYDTYDVSQFLRYLNDSKETREIIVNMDDGNDDPVIGLPGFSGLLDNGSFAGLAIIAIVILVVLSFVTDLVTPGR